MKIILAADGSKCTERSIDFLVAHESLTGLDGDVVVLNVQAEMPLRMRAMFGREDAESFYKEESAKVLQPISLFLERHEVRHRSRSTVGEPAAQIIAVAREEHADLILMGTHGHGLVGRALMGSVAQKVLEGSDIPVLLVR
jgi:nucleotide-binding universal stress UspA family protein